MNQLVTQIPQVQVLIPAAGGRIQVDTPAVSGQSAVLQDEQQNIVTSSDQTIQTVLVQEQVLFLVSNEKVHIISEAKEGVPGRGVPAGGNSGELLTKTSSEDYDTAWSMVNLSTQVTGKLAFTNMQTIASQTVVGRSSQNNGDMEALSPLQLRQLLGFQHGLNVAGETIFSQSIPASSSVMQQIALQRSDWTHGIMMVRDTNASGVGSGAIIMFSTENNKAAGLSGSVFYGSTPSWVSGARTRLANFDGFVTESIFTNSSNIYDIRIDAMRIDGANIMVEWRNLNIISRTVSARMRWFVWRGDQVNA